MGAEKERSKKRGKRGSEAGVEGDSFDGICNSLFGSLMALVGRRPFFHLFSLFWYSSTLYFIHMRNGQVVKRQ